MVSLCNVKLLQDVIEQLRAKHFQILLLRKYSLVDDHFLIAQKYSFSF